MTQSLGYILLAWATIGGIFAYALMGGFDDPATATAASDTGETIVSGGYVIWSISDEHPLPCAPSEAAVWSVRKEHDSCVAFADMSYVTHD
jgi:hypothetical protein